MARTNKALTLLHREQLDVTSRQFNSRAPHAPGPDATRETQLKFLEPISGPTDRDADLSVTRKLETDRRKLRDRVARLEDDVARLEAQLEVEHRWQPGDILYDETIKYIETQHYQKALGKLQRLVLLRLFELHKLNLAQTGRRSKKPRF